jgi:hypothetical protein
MNERKQRRETVRKGTEKDKEYKKPSLWKPKVQYHVHRSPPSISILGHMNPVHILTLVSVIYFNIIFPHTPNIMTS